MWDDTWWILSSGDMVILSGGGYVINEANSRLACLNLGIEIVLRVFVSGRDCTFIKLDGVGPVDNRPSNDYLHQIVREKNIYISFTGDMLQVTCDR